MPNTDAVVAGALGWMIEGASLRAGLAARAWVSAYDTIESPGPLSRAALGATREKA